MIIAPPAPLPRLTVGITGHRSGNRSFAANRPAIAAAIDRLFGAVDAAVAQQTAALGPVATTRLHNLLACGVDELAAAAACRYDWNLVAPLPFGRQLNLAINARPQGLADATALLEGQPVSDPATATRAAAMTQWYGKARLFELAEQDAAVGPLYLAHLADPADFAVAEAFAALSSERAALAGRVMIEQSDLLFAVWDGVHHNLVGGTGHTIAVALDHGIPVLWIDPAEPENWRLLSSSEAISARASLEPGDDALLGELIRGAMRPGEGGALKRGAEVLASEAWHATSSRFGKGYRRVEALFGGGPRPFRSLDVRYEEPAEIGRGSGAAILALARELAPADPEFCAGIEQETLRRFAWADGISSRLSDSYRSGMIANFLLSALAVAVGLAYQPLHVENNKWAFALGEFLLLCTIVAITWIGRRRHWHKRWFETRRVAEYFRHAPILQLLGVARPTGRWPRGAETSWPEYYVRHGLRALGLPQIVIDPGHLRRGLTGLLELHVLPQRDYHRSKVLRLTTVHHRLDRLSLRLFLVALASVTSWLALSGLAALGLVPADLPRQFGSFFTFLGVMCPMLGASIAGIRYFGDFERFAAISEATAEKLDVIGQRIAILLAAPDERLSYAQAADLAHSVDRVVTDEIENWQAVFGGKDIAIPI